MTVFACTFTAGTVTGATAIFTDPRDGKKYKTVVMPDGKTWFAQNLNYTQGLTFNAYVSEANGKAFTSSTNGVPAIGSYWCPPKYVGAPVVSGDEAACNVYGALYTWETAMMVDGKYADMSKTNSAWEESWVSSNYFASGAPGSTANADKNNARGGTSVKGGGRGICPMGWHIPTDYEWAQLLDKVEGNTTFTESQTASGWWGTDAGKKMKSASTLTDANANDAPPDGSWSAHDNIGVDPYHFALLPAGTRTSDGAVFKYRGTQCHHWSSSVGSDTMSWIRYLWYDIPQVGRHRYYRSYGLTLRCVMD